MSDIQAATFAEAFPGPMDRLPIRVGCGAAHEGLKAITRGVPGVDGSTTGNAVARGANTAVKFGP